MAEAEFEQTLGTEEIVEEKITKGQTLVIIFICMIVVGLWFLYRQRRNEKERKRNSFVMKYRFSLPHEKKLFERKLKQRPVQNGRDNSLSSEEEVWHKECCSILLRRAILDIGLHIQVSRDYFYHNQLYRRGITLEIWQEVQEARKVINREIEQVKLEAERLKPGWGETILQQAANLRHHLEMMNRKQEIEKSKKDEQLRLEKQRAKEKLLEERRKAEAEKAKKRRSEKLAEQLIKEEEEQKKKKSK